MYMLLYPIQFININYPKSLTFNPLGANVSKLYAQNASLCVGSFIFVLSIIITLRSAKPSCSSPKKCAYKCSHIPHDEEGLDSMRKILEEFRDKTTFSEAVRGWG